MGQTAEQVPHWMHLKMFWPLVFLSRLAKASRLRLVMVITA
jgi:hypothetical protein